MKIVDESLIIKTYNEGINAVIFLVKGLSEQITALKDEVSGVKIENQKLNHHITKLEVRLNKNSGNSRKSLLSDRCKKLQNSRQKTEKPTGGQWRHEVKTLEKAQNPDEVIVYKILGTCAQDENS